MRVLTHPDLDQVDVTAVLHALSDPVRLKIVRELADSGCYCGELDVPVKPATLSHHLKVLREAGLIRVHAEGSRRWHELRYSELADRFPGLVDTVLAAPALATRT
ncbi:MAG: ArsR/SmtB family transcription factor [Frankia sp.]